MRFPVARTTDEFYRDWYIASRFGENRGSYYHSGDDYNLKTGGNSDLGQPLYACADGIITGVDTTSTTGFGRQIYLAFKVNGKQYYAHYAHCQTVKVKQGDRVKQGDIIGTLGNSGTIYAHLHFSIKNRANGMDNVPNTKQELREWEDPTAFIEKHLGEEKMTDCRQAELDRDHWWNNQVRLYEAVVPGEEFKESTADSQIDGAIQTINEERKAWEQGRRDVKDLEKQVYNLKKELKTQNTELNNEINEIAEQKRVLQKQYDALQRKVAKPIRVEPQDPPAEVSVAGIDWEVNGLQIDSYGTKVANYQKKHY